MRALLYADWCVIKGTIPRVLGVCLIVCAPTMLSSMGGDGRDAGTGMAAIMVMMLTFYTCLGLFGSDEQAGWELARLALPVTARDVVRSRYAFVALTALGTAVAGTLAGLVARVVLGAGARPALAAGLLELGGTSVAMVLVALAYQALMMPAIFRLGMSKARLLFSLPFVLLTLVVLEPVRQLAQGVELTLTRLVEHLGTPMPLFAAGASLVAVFYLVSMRAAERLYATREL